MLHLLDRVDPLVNLLTHARAAMAMLAKGVLIAALVTGLTACNLSNDPGRRTPGVVIDDGVLENVVEREIRAADLGYKGSHIVIVAYNGVVLIAGQVPTALLKEKASTVTQGIRRVRKVHNELTVGGPTSIFARSNDGWLTSKVKSRLIAARETNGSKIKVQTENGVVYLMGLVSREQADAAVNVTRNVYGVQKIVKVFEYLD